jgi:hypothetical protein
VDRRIIVQGQPGQKVSKMLYLKKKKKKVGLGTVTHIYNPSCLRDRDKEDHSLRSAWAKSLWDPLSTSKKLGMLTHTWHSNSAGGLQSRMAQA